jgi:hypothetical protein
MKKFVHCHPPRSRIVLSSKNLNLSPARAHSFDQPVHLIWFATRLAHLAHDNVSIESTVCPGGENEVPRSVSARFDTDKHVLFRVVEPVACSASADHALELLNVRK